MNKVEVFKRKYADRLIAHKTEGYAIKSIDEIIKLDPTPSGKYLPWIASLILANNLKSEDFYKVTQYLTEIQRPALRQAMMKDGLQPNVEQYKTLPELAKNLSKYEQLKSKNEELDLEKEKARSESRVHFEDENLLIVEPFTEEASCFWGKGTQWCTAATSSENMYSRYAPDGEGLYIFIFKQEKDEQGRAVKYQFSFEGGLADVNDRNIGWKGMPEDHANSVMEVGFLTEQDCWVAIEKLEDEGYQWALKNIPEVFRSEAMCLAAVEKNGWALEYVPDHSRTESMYVAAVKQNGGALRHVPDHLRTESICRAAVEQDGLVLDLVPDRLRTDSVCLAAVEENGWALAGVPKKLLNEEMCLVAVKQNGHALRHVPDHLRTDSVCLAAVSQTGLALANVPAPLRTESVCLVAIKKDVYSLNYVPKEIQPRVQQLLAQPKGASIPSRAPSM
jgi:hypothetical protein